MNISGQATLNAFSMTGENSYTTTFNGGKSKLIWPIDVKTAGVALTLSKNDLIEVELGIIAEPWGENGSPMKDYDWLDESYYGVGPLHQGLDIYSQSALDSKAMIYSIRSRVFPLRYRYLSIGASAGYEYQEFDYRAYDTRQVGYGPWSDSTINLSGPGSTYSVDYGLFSIGLVLRSSIDDVVVITLDTSVMPVVTANDEDNHLRRSRLDRSSCKGAGYQTTLSTAFKASGHWYISTLCGLSRIHTDGHQKQFWYETGTTNNLDVEIDQQAFRTSIGATYRF